MNKIRQQQRRWEKKKSRDEKRATASVDASKQPTHICSIVKCQRTISRSCKRQKNDVYMWCYYNTYRIHWFHICFQQQQYAIKCEKEALTHTHTHKTIKNFYFYFCFFFLILLFAFFFIRCKSRERWTKAHGKKFKVKRRSTTATTTRQRKKKQKRSNLGEHDRALKIAHTTANNDKLAHVPITIIAKYWTEKRRREKSRNMK